MPTAKTKALVQHWRTTTRQWLRHWVQLFLRSPFLRRLFLRRQLLRRLAHLNWRILWGRKCSPSSLGRQPVRPPTSASFLAEISFRAPCFFLNFHYLEKSFLDQSIQKSLYLILKTEALPPTQRNGTSAVILFSKLKCNKTNQIKFFENFDPVHVFLCNKNKLFLG